MPLVAVKTAVASCGAIVILCNIAPYFTIDGLTVACIGDVANYCPINKIPSPVIVSSPVTGFTANGVPIAAIGSMLSCGHPIVATSQSHFTSL